MDTPMETFGERLKDMRYIERKGAYGIVLREDKIAVIKTESGLFLPGGGIEGAESHIECLKREFLEETGYGVNVGEYIGSASLYHMAKTKEYFHGIGYFYLVKLQQQSKDIKAEHRLLWIELEKAKEGLYLEDQRWALDQVNS